MGMAQMNPGMLYTGGLFGTRPYDLEDVFSVFLPNGAQRLIFTMNYHLREDQVFTILTPNWPNSTSDPRGASGVQCGQNLTQSGSNLIPIG